MRFHTTPKVERGQGGRAQEKGGGVKREKTPFGRNRLFYAIFLGYRVKCLMEEGEGLWGYFYGLWRWDRNGL